MTVRALGLAVLSGAAADDCPFSDVSVALAMSRLPTAWASSRA